MAKIHYKGDLWTKHLLFREVNNTIMRKFVILFVENVIKQLPKEKLDKITFIFSIRDSFKGEGI